MGDKSAIECTWCLKDHPAVSLTHGVCPSCLYDLAQYQISHPGWDRVPT